MSAKALNRLRIVGRRAWIEGKESVSVGDLSRFYDATDALWGDSAWQDLALAEAHGHLVVVCATRAEAERWHKEDQS